MLKFEEEEEGLRLKSEEEARLAEEARLKKKEHKRAPLKVEDGVRLSLEARRK